MIRKSFLLILLFSFLVFSNITQAMIINFEGIYQDVAQKISNQLYEEALQEIPNINKNTWINMANNNNLGNIDKLKAAINNISNDAIVETLQNNELLVKKAIPYIFKKEIRRAAENIINNQNYYNNVHERARDFDFTDIIGSFLHEIHCENEDDVDEVVDIISLYFVNIKKSSNFIIIEENIQLENQGLYQPHFQEYQNNNLYAQEHFQEYQNNDLYAQEHFGYVLDNELVNKSAEVIAVKTKTFLIDKMIDFNNFACDTDNNNESKTNNLKIGVTAITNWNSARQDINKALFVNIYGKYDLNISRQLQLRSKASVIGGSFVGEKNNSINLSQFMGGFYAEYELAHMKNNLSLKVSYKDFEGKRELCSQATLPLFTNIDIIFEARKEFLKSPPHQDEELKTIWGIYLNTYEGIYNINNYVGFSQDSMLIGTDFGFSFKNNRFSVFSNLRYTPVKNAVNNFEPNSLDIGAMFRVCLAKNYYLNGYFIAQQNKMDDIDVMGALNFSLQF